LDRGAWVRNLEKAEEQSGSIEHHHEARSFRFSKAKCNQTTKMEFNMSFRNGLASLLRPEDSVLVLIDHQPYQLANLNSHDPHVVVNNSAGLAKAAKVFDVPTILTSVVADRGGHIFPQITGVFPGQEIIDRTFINTWEDPKVLDVVKATGRKQLVLAGLWTEVCVAMPAIQAAGEGWDVTVVTDACGAVSIEAHEVAIKRMIAAGVNMITWMALAAEWQRDWARAETAAALNDVVIQHAAGSGIAYLWEQQLLNTPVANAAG
jgi:nicotinamidase-related amidase